MAIDPNVNFYMRVPLGRGEFTDGRVDYTSHPRMLGLENADLSGERVLDIAANDGFWTFWADGRGASELLAIDIEGFDDYDWGYGGPPDWARRYVAGFDFSAQWAAPGEGFRAIKEHLGSTANLVNLSVYDLDPNVHGQFDLVFNYGLLYHLRHPLLSIDRVRAVTRGALILETHTVNTLAHLPAFFFYEEDQFREPTNWTGPNETVVATWLRSAGFDDIWVRRPRGNTPNGRTIFAAALTAKWAERFRAAPALEHLDTDYFDEVHRATRRFVGEEE